MSRVYEPDPNELVREIMQRNPSADPQHIRNLVFKAVTTTERSFLRPFVDKTTDIAITAVVREKTHEKARQERERQARLAREQKEREAERYRTDPKYRAQVDARHADAAKAETGATDKAFASLRTRIALNGKPLGAVTRKENNQFARFHEAVEKTMPAWALQTTTLNKSHGDKLDKIKTWTD